MNQVEYDDMAKEIAMAVAALNRALPTGMSPEDIRHMAISMMIQTNWGRGSGSSKPNNGGGKYEGPCSEAQQNLIAVMVGERGKEGEEVVLQYLDGKKNTVELSMSKATTLIDMLKEIKTTKQKAKERGKPIGHKEQR